MTKQEQDTLHVVQRFLPSVADAMADLPDGELLEFFRRLLEVNDMESEHG